MRIDSNEGAGLRAPVQDSRARSENHRSAASARSNTEPSVKSRSITRPVQRLTMPLWAGLFYGLVPAARRGIEGNLDQVLGDEGAWWRKLRGYRLFWNYAQVLESCQHRCPFHRATVVGVKNQTFWVDVEAETRL